MQLKKRKNQNSPSSKDLTELIRLFDTIKGKLSISKSATEVSGDNIFYPSEIFKETLPKCIGNGRYKIRYEVIQENSYLLVEEGVLSSNSCLCVS